MTTVLTFPSTSTAVPTTFSLSDLAVRVMRDLNIINAVDPPSAEDMTYVQQTIQSEYARMVADGINFQSTSVNAIPIVYLTELSRRMGFAIATAFGILDAATAEAGKEASEGVLRRLGVPVKKPEVLTIERAARGTKIRDPIISQS